ncbi:M14 family metallopeptidase [Kordiimonas aquimaris]|uniref:M14 family metallopeptidase n=1 Tax=Kordiimonas aquimaris TaxID=707591 RepID=UPI0021CF207F|nr:M14-type cytosolic carboxypeptidase [Kordiimonas aquimaris]
MKVFTIKNMFVAFLSLFVVVVPSSFANADQPKQICKFDALVISADFSGGRVNGCKQIAASHYRVFITPEDEPPINPSPWYAFKLVPSEAGEVSIEIKYTHGKHRYWPKVSSDQENWSRLSRNAVDVLEDGSVKLSIALENQPVYVAGQEVLTAAFHKNWARELTASHDLLFEQIGQSKQKRSIFKVETKGGAAQKDYIFVVGRQHPPEVTGALALLPFVDEVFGGSDLSKQFLEMFGVIVVPMLNPDGVENGHWRHNTGSKDLNRDWGPFTQPETQLMREELNRFNADEKLWLFLDFHSTGRNVLYTQGNEEITAPADFAVTWSKRARERLPNYEFEQAERPVTELPTSKNYVYSTFGAPAITYEVGDETDREAIENAARVFAQEMMHILLEAKAKTKTKD